MIDRTLFSDARFRADRGLTFQLQHSMYNKLLLVSCVMTRATTVQARIEPELKEMGDAILKKIGITASQAINALYAQIVMRKGLPFK